MTAQGAFQRPGAAAGAAAQESAPRRYSAFISYSHADRALAARLQARLERYRLPRRLAQRLGATRVRPVFLDRDELRAAADLDGALGDALDQSDYLIVLCTPNTPGSEWVGREIAAFRERRGQSGILAAMFGGTEAQCFHSALMPQGTAHAHLPLAADFRRTGDGPRLALLKLLAVLIDVDLDTLARRDAQRSRRRLMLTAGAAGLVALVIAALGFFAWSARQSAEQAEIRQAKAMEFQLNELRAKVKAGGTLDMAAAVNRGVELFYAGQNTSNEPIEIALGRAKLLHAETDDDAQRGDIKSAAAHAREAWDITAAQLKAAPRNEEAIYTHAQSAYWMAFVAWRQDDTPLAALMFDRYAQLADALVRRDPDKADWQLEQAYANSNLGVLAVAEARDPARAERYFETAQRDFEKVAASQPDNLDLVYEMADGEAWLAEAAAQRGQYALAQQHRDAQYRLQQRLLAREPGNRLYRSDRLSYWLGQARLDAMQGHHAKTIAELRAARPAAQALAAEDPANRSIAERVRALALFEARSELALAEGRPEAVRHVRQLVGDCAGDWREGRADGERGTLCALLTAGAALRDGDRAAAQRALAAPRVAEAMKRRALSRRWFLDFRAECARIVDPALCG